MFDSKISRINSNSRHQAEWITLVDFSTFAFKSSHRAPLKNWINTRLKHGLGTSIRFHKGPSGCRCLFQPSHRTPDWSLLIKCSETLESWLVKQRGLKNLQPLGPFKSQFDIPLQIIDGHVASFVPVSGTAWWVTHVWQPRGWWTAAGSVVKGVLCRVTT